MKLCKMHRIITALLACMTVCCASKQCPTNCSVWSINVEDSRRKHFVECLVTKQSCRPNNKDSIIKVTEAKIFELVWKTGLNGKQILLHIEFHPTEDNLVEFLTGYKINIFPMFVADKYKRTRHNFTTNFCLTHDVDFKKHAKMFFTYDCFGMFEPHEIDPGDKFKVQIYNYPDLAKEASSEIQIPKCASGKFEKHPLCVEENKFNVTIKYICSENAVYVSYALPPKFGHITSIVLHAIGNNYIRNVTGLLVPLNGTEKVAFSSEDMRENYTLIVYANERFDMKRTLEVSFQDCLNRSEAEENLRLLSLGLSLCFVLVFIGVVIVCSTRPRKQYELDFRLPVIDNTDLALDNISLVNRKKLLLIYMDDNPLHLNLGKVFADYLEEDLNFDILTPLKNFSVVCQSIEKWTCKALEEAHKVIIISSPIMDRIFEATWNDKHLEESISFLHSISVTVVKEAIFMPPGQNKFYYCSFGESKMRPIALNNLEIWKIGTDLKNFLQLYFRLVGIEQYNYGKTVTNTKITKYSEPNVTTHGGSLLSAIKDLQNTIKDVRTHTCDRNSYEDSGFYSPSIEPLIDQPTNKEPHIHACNTVTTSTNSELNYVPKGKALNTDTHSLELKVELPEIEGLAAQSSFIAHSSTSASDQQDLHSTSQSSFKLSIFSECHESDCESQAIFKEVPEDTQSTLDSLNKDSELLVTQDMLNSLNDATMLLSH